MASLADYIRTGVPFSNEQLILAIHCLINITALPSVQPSARISIIAPKSETQQTMSGAYKIFGRTYQAHQLAIATLSVVALCVMPNPFAAKKPKTVELNASSPEEEEFIKNYLEKHSKA